MLQRQHAQTQQAQLQASLQVLQAAALASQHQEQRAAQPPLVHEETREIARTEETHRIGRQHVERPEQNIQTNGFRFVPTEASTSMAGQRT